MKNFDDIDLKLCHCCGTCIGVCPTEAISMVDNLPRLTGKCTDCALCYETCPGIEFRYPEFNKRLFGESKVDSEVGYYRSINVGHATDETVRKKGASGGVVTALLLGLLKRGEIKGAVVVGMDKECPWLLKVKIATTAQEIIDAAQSKYSTISVNEILNRLNAINGDVAFVGLPCHIHGVRKLQYLGWKTVGKIRYCIGVFCGFNMERKATDFLINRLKVKNEDIRSLEYRGGDWPGGFRLKTKDDRIYFIEKHHYNYLNLMFVPKRCLVCPDFTNEFADISVGDAWNRDLDSSSWSTIIIRTTKGEELIDCAVDAKDIIIKASDKGKLKEGHSHLVVYKKKGVFIRQKLLGMSPDFHLPQPTVKTYEKIFNLMFFYLISFMRTGFAINFCRYMPIALPGILGKHFRAMANLIFQPKRDRSKEAKGNGIFYRVRMEWKYLTIRKWDFRDVGTFWNSVTDYDDVNKEMYSYLRRFIDGYRFSNLHKGSYVLDICSRTGNGTLFFWERGVVKKAVCADFTEKMQGLCAKRLKEAGVPFEQKLIESVPLPFKDDEFDAVLCFETVEHLPNPKDFIRELARVIKKGGQIVLSTPNVLWGPIHSLAAILNIHHSEGPHRFISRKNLRRYISDVGLSIIKEETTVLIPAGPRFLVRFGEWVEKKSAKNLMPLFGLRRIFICKKN